MNSPESRRDLIRRMLEEQLGRLDGPDQPTWSTGSFKDGDSVSYEQAQRIQEAIACNATLIYDASGKLVRMHLPSGQRLKVTD